MAVMNLTASKEGAKAISMSAQGKKAGEVTKAYRDSIKFETLESADLPHRIVMFGHSGSGKTFTIVAFLLMGLKVFVLSTDLGGPGLRTVKNELVRLGREDLLPNILFIHFGGEDAYLKVSDFLQYPEEFGEVYKAFEPDIHVWDGYTGFQAGAVEDHVCGDSSISELQFDIPTYGKMKRATLKQIRRFLDLLTPSGRVVHKFVTFLESKPKENDLTGDVRKGPLIAGTAGPIIEAMFDLMIETYADASGNFKYRCKGTKGIAAKSRGYAIGAEEPADMQKLWAKINGLSATEVKA